MDIKYDIQGMTCESCVEKISERLRKIPQVEDVKVSLAEKSAILKTSASVDLKTVQQAIADLPKYSISLFSTKSENKVAAPPIEESWVKTYKPLITVFTYVFLVSLAFQIYQGHFESEIFMNHLMAGFFIGLSFFKFLDLKSFAESFSSYDPIAQRFLSYGLIYPFIELALGLSFITGLGLTAANIITVIILSVTTIGVIKRLQSKSKFVCACLGTAFSLPLSKVTVIENLIMILMALYNLKFILV